MPPASKESSRRSAMLGSVASLQLLGIAGKSMAAKACLRHDDLQAGLLSSITMKMLLDLSVCDVLYGSARSHRDCRLSLSTDTGALVPLQDVLSPIAHCQPAAESVNSMVTCGDSFPMAFAQLLPAQAAAALGPTLAALPSADQLAFGGLSALLGILYVFKVVQAVLVCWPPIPVYGIL